MTKFTPPKEERKERELIPAGMKLARCYSFIDLGTQKVEWQGNVKLQRKIRLTWEIPEEKRVFNEEAGEQPMVIGKEYTLSFFELSALSKDLKSWIGFKEGDKATFDPSKDLVGRECMLNITHEESKNGNAYHKITAITPLPKGTECEEQINPSVYFFMGYENKQEDFDEETLDGLPEFLQKKIKESTEYKTTHGELPIPKEAQEAPEEDEVKPEDLPF